MSSHVNLSFIVQRHDAAYRGLHYDFRLEKNGVYLSWVLEEVPPLVKGIKRTAVRVNDHTLEWGEFEGEISNGYGKGSVTTWDKGSLAWVDYLDSFILKGAILDGCYSLTPFRDIYLLEKV